MGHEEVAPEVMAAIMAQGEKVRELKTAKADVAEIKEAVALLLKLKGDAGLLKPKAKKKKSDGPTDADKLQKKKAERRAQRGGNAAPPAIQAVEADVPQKNVSKNFGDFAVNRSTVKTGRVFTEVPELNASLIPAEGEEEKLVWVRARLHSVRSKGRMSFVVLRSATHTVQGVLFAGDSFVNKQMIRYVTHVEKESIVDICGVVTKPKDPILSMTVSEVEISVRKICVVSRAAPNCPVSVEDLSRSDAQCEKENLPSVERSTRLDNRWMDLRAPAHHAIFRVQSKVQELFRGFLYTRGFTEIHTPKIIGAASEGGADVFKLGYFGMDGFLAQSPQLYKQMAIASGLERVMEIGPVFRAENSHTHRHLCEFMGMDMEMAFKDHYHEVLDVIEECFTYIFTQLQETCQTEIETVRKQYPSEPLVFPKETVRITFREGIDLLRTTEEYKDHAFEDIGTTAEKVLGGLVKEKYNTDFYLMDKFPTTARPFYTMEDPADPEVTNSYDAFLRGEEICSGAQRIHDPEMLAAKAIRFGTEPASIQAYIDSFKYGAPPHAGMGVGLERIVMLFLGLPNIRLSSLFPRDPTRIAP